MPPKKPKDKGANAAGGLSDQAEERLKANLGFLETRVQRLSRQYDEAAAYIKAPPVETSIAFVIFLIRSGRMVLWLNIPNPN